jgi:hypothetical protein
MLTRFTVHDPEPCDLLAVHFEPVNDDGQTIMTGKSVCLMGVLYPMLRNAPPLIVRGIYLQLEPSGEVQIFEDSNSFQVILMAKVPVMVQHKSFMRNKESC